MIEAAFETARRLFGLLFKPVDMPLYHPDARAWDVTDAHGRHVGLFIGDYFARSSKHSGAWMTSLRDQERADRRYPPDHPQRLQFLQAGGGRAGAAVVRRRPHAVSRIRPRAARDAVQRDLSAARRHRVPSDFVELPSQLYEHWLEVPEILQKYARHFRTGEPMPKALLDELLATRTFNQGFATVEYTACALVDLDLHSLPDAPDGLDVSDFERKDA